MADEKKIDIASFKLLLQGIASKVDSSLSASLTKTKQRVDDAIKASKVATVSDKYGNTLTATGSEDKAKQFASYGFSNDTLNYSLWTALYNDDWTFRKAIDKPSQDIVKLGIILNMKDANKKAEVEKLLRQHKSKLTQLFKWGHLYGGSIAIMMFDNFTDEMYNKPISENKAILEKSTVMKLYVTDRWYGVSVDVSKTVTDMTSLDYGKPVSYTIKFSDGSTLKVHHDYVLRYEHRDAPPLIKNGQLQGWGYAEGAHIFNELYRDSELKSSITSLINKSLIEVIKMDGMRGLFQGADEESENQLKARLEMVNWARSFNSLTFLDSQDDYQMNNFSGLGGLADLMEKNMWLISAALDQQGVLYGDLTQGFSHDADALERYDDIIKSKADDYARPVYEKLIKTIFTWKGVNEQVDFEFGSLLTDIKNAKKNEALDKHISRLKELLDMGVLTLTDVGRSINKFLETGEVDLNITEESLKKAEEKANEESEGIDLL